MLVGTRVRFRYTFGQEPVLIRFFYPEQVGVVGYIIREFRMVNFWKFTLKRAKKLDNQARFVFVKWSTYLLVNHGTDGLFYGGCRTVVKVRVGEGYVAKRSNPEHKLLIFLTREFATTFIGAHTVGEFHEGIAAQHRSVVTGGAPGILKQVQPCELTFIQRFIVAAHVLVEWSIGCNERALECSQGFGRVGERYRFVILRKCCCKVREVAGTQ